MAKAKDESAGPVAPAAEAATTQYHYVGATVSFQAIAGVEVKLAPGDIVTLPSADPVVARLLKQRLLVPHTRRVERHG